MTPSEIPGTALRSPGKCHLRKNSASDGDRGMWMRRLELVICDCDGVLVDSELITNRVFAAMLTELGLPVSVAWLFENFVG